MNGILLKNREEILNFKHWRMGNWSGSKGWKILNLTKIIKKLLMTGNWKKFIKKLKEKKIKKENPMNNNKNQFKI